MPVPVPNFELREVLHRSRSGELKASAGLELGVLTSDHVRCARTAPGAAVCVNTNLDKHLDGSSIAWPATVPEDALGSVKEQVYNGALAFDVADVLANGERCFAVEPPRALVVAPSEASADMHRFASERVFVCGASKPAALHSLFR